MTDQSTVAESAPSPAQPKVKRRRKFAKRRSTRPPSDEPPAPKQRGVEFDGMTATLCPAACTLDHCVISTKAVCKHPHKSADSGCGPVTLRNREKAKNYLKRLKIDSTD